MTFETDVAFVSGYLEGEGHFRVRGNTPEIEAKSINPSSLDKLQALLGGKVRPGSKPQKPNHRQSWVWGVTGTTAVEAARVLMDGGHLNIKSAECRAVARCRDYPAGTIMGDYLRRRASDLRAAEYPV